MLKNVALLCGEIIASNSADLEQIRSLIEVLKVLIELQYLGSSF